jgi:hypothetical protein
MFNFEIHPPQGSLASTTATIMGYPLDVLHTVRAGSTGKAGGEPFVSVAKRLLKQGALMEYNNVITR